MPAKGNNPDDFWARVAFGGMCWEWQGHLDIGGYGRTSWTHDGLRKSTPAHRVSWELCTHSPVPDGLWVLHHCDNRRCVRPDHLFLGTVLDNNRDMLAKGRARYVGSKHPRAKITESDVRAIRREYQRPRSTARSIAVKYNVSEATIRKIVEFRGWTHVT